MGSFWRNPPLCVLSSEEIPPSLFPHPSHPFSPSYLSLPSSFAYSHRNVRGRNQKLNISLERGQFDSIFRFNYTDPWIEGDDKRTSRSINVQVFQTHDRRVVQRHAAVSGVGDFMAIHCSSSDEVLNAERNRRKNTATISSGDYWHKVAANLIFLLSFIVAANFESSPVFEFYPFCILPAKFLQPWWSQSRGADPPPFGLGPKLWRGQFTSALYTCLLPVGHNTLSLASFVLLSCLSLRTPEALAPPSTGCRERGTRPACGTGG